MSTDVIRNKFVELGDAEISAAVGTLTARALSGTAPVVEVYEQKLKEYFGARECVACSSGTAAIHAALAACGVRAGDEVILPPTGAVMTALPIIALGAVPVFADTVSSDSFALDVEDVRRARTDRTRAIISVPMWGYPFDLAPLLSLSDELGIPVIEDAAQAHGSRVHERPVGARGYIGCFSTHERKLISTGEGGFLLTDHPEAARALRTFVHLGRGGDRADASLPFGSEVGLNLKLNAVAAAIGSVQVTGLESRIARRTANAHQLCDMLSDLDGWRELPIRKSDLPNYYGLVLVIDGDASPGRRMGEILAHQGIACDTHEYQYRPLYEYTMFRDSARPCPNAESLIGRVVALPVHEGLGPDELARIAAAIRTALKTAT